jgi:hypothetical protein
VRPSKQNKGQAAKAKIDKLYSINLKSFCTQRKQHSEEATYRMGENICKLYI